MAPDEPKPKKRLS